MTVLVLRFCARAFSSCGKWGPLFIAVHGSLTITASLVVEHRLQTRRLSNCGSRAQLLRGMWDLPRPGLEPMSPALSGRFSASVPPGKPLSFFFFFSFFFWAVWLTASWCCGQVSGLNLWGGRAGFRTLIHHRPPGPTWYQLARALPEISVSTLRPISTQRPANSSVGHPMSNN